MRFLTMRFFIMRFLVDRRRSCVRPRALAPLASFCSRALVACAVVAPASQAVLPSSARAEAHAAGAHCEPLLQAIAQAGADAPSLGNVAARLRETKAAAQTDFPPRPAPGPRTASEDDTLFAWADCARETQDALFQFFEAHERTLWSGVRESLDPLMSALQDFVGTVRGALQDRSRKGLVADDPRMPAAMRAFALTWDISTLCAALEDEGVDDATKDVLASLVSHLEPLWLYSEVPHKAFLSRLACLREESALSNPASARLALAAQAQYAAWAGSTFTRKHGERVVKGLEDSIAMLQDILSRGSLSEEERRAHEESLAKLRKDLDSVKAFGVGVTSFVNGVEKAYPEPWRARVREAIEAAFTAQRDGLLMRSHRLQEGDMFLSVSNVGAGDLISMAANQPGFGAHSGILGRDDSEGWPVYFTAEWGGRLSVSSALEAPHMQDNVWVRPSFAPRPGFVGRTVANLEKHPRHAFDTLMKEGILGRKGEVSLYCAEFVHFAFENEADTASTARLPSPFHDEISHVSGIGERARANFLALGFDPAGRYFNPSALLFSERTRPLFATFNQYTSFFGGGPDAPEAQAWAHMEALSSRFNQRFAHNFALFPLKPVPLSERILLESALSLQNVASAFQRWKGSKGGNDDTPIGGRVDQGEVELPTGPARYGMMKVANALTGLFGLVDETLATAGKDPAWREKADHAFETKHLPRMLKLFDVDAGAR